MSLPSSCIVDSLQIRVCYLCLNIFLKYLLRADIIYGSIHQIAEVIQFQLLYNIKYYYSSHLLPINPSALVVQSPYRLCQAEYERKEIPSYE